MRRSLILITATAAFCASTAVPADVYMYKDADGNVQYTDKPTHLPAERLNVQSRRTDTVAVQARQQAELERMQQSNQARAQASSTQAEQREAAQLTAKDKAERCVKARERYDSYMNSQRLYEALPDGQRRYLTDAELDAARASAKSSMDSLCQ